MTLKEDSSFNRKFTLPQNFSDEEMARDWTLTENDKQEINNVLLTGFFKKGHSALKPA
jgi:hypothetical protein